MSAARKSEWCGVSCHTERSQKACLSWFSPICDDMTVEKAEILCDIETGREKKIRAFVIDKTGRRRTATRTLGGKTFTIKLERAKP